VAEIRLLTTADGTRLEALYAECFDEPLATATRESLLASPGMWASIAWDGEGAAGEATGFVIARSIADEAEIISIGVPPDCRRRGIGGALLADALFRAVALGAQSVFLEVAEDNPGAIAFYRCAGFETVGRRPDYYRRKSRPAIAALIMRHTVKKSDS
jgi:[ribosomal protein S18]-alanine N-acetyltransferase